MKPETNQPDDNRLRALLRESRPQPTPPPGIEQGVWRRIERAERPPETHWIHGLAGLLFRPRLAFACLAAVTVLGAASGLFSSASAGRSDAQARYVAAVDPFQRRP